jgi:hypothetical protein
MKDRPLHLGAPVPYITSWEGSVPVLDRVHHEKVEFCFEHEICPWCGNAGRLNTFIVPGMEAIVTRLTGLPPLHVACALYAVRNGSFFTGQPLTLEMHDSWRGLTNGGDKATKGAVLFGRPKSVGWWFDGEPLEPQLALVALDDYYEQAVDTMVQTVEERGGLDLLIDFARTLVPEEKTPQL